jgi:hypothetical protein
VFKTPVFFKSSQTVLQTLFFIWVEMFMPTLAATRWHGCWLLLVRRCD